MIAVAVAGIGEEILFRGFTVTRLAMLTGRTWLAALITVVGFYLIHVPVWGWGFALGGLVSGAAVRAFFVWCKDLLAVIIFHVSTDAIGLIVAPSSPSGGRHRHCSDRHRGTCAVTAAYADLLSQLLAMYYLQPL